MSTSLRRLATSRDYNKLPASPDYSSNANGISRATIREKKENDAKKFKSAYSAPEEGGKGPSNGITTCNENFYKILAYKTISSEASK
jgi:hypothetical protein